MFVPALCPSTLVLGAGQVAPVQAKWSVTPLAPIKHYGLGLSGGSAQGHLYRNHGSTLANWPIEPRQTKMRFCRVGGSLDSHKSFFRCRAQPRQAKMRFLLRRRPAFGRAACEEKCCLGLSRQSSTPKKCVWPCRGKPQQDKKVLGPVEADFAKSASSHPFNFLS